MPPETPQTNEELAEKYRGYAHKCVFNAMIHKETISGPKEYVEKVAMIIDDVIDGVIQMRTDMEIDEMRKKVQELLNP